MSESVKMDMAKKINSIAKEIEDIEEKKHSKEREMENSVIELLEKEFETMTGYEALKAIGDDFIIFFIVMNGYKRYGQQKSGHKKYFYPGETKFSRFSNGSFADGFYYCYFDTIKMKVKEKGRIHREFFNLEDMLEIMYEDGEYIMSEDIENLYSRYLSEKYDINVKLSLLERDNFVHDDAWKDDYAITRFGMKYVAGVLEVLERNTLEGVEKMMMYFAYRAEKERNETLIEYFKRSTFNFYDDREMFKVKNYFGDWVEEEAIEGVLERTCGKGEPDITHLELQYAQFKITIEEVEQ